MKFEITERIISNSRSIYFLRLFMIRYYDEKRREIEREDPASPELANWTISKMGVEYKRLIFSLINNLNMAHHTPG